MCIEPCVDKILFKVRVQNIDTQTRGIAKNSMLPTIQGVDIKKQHIHTKVQTYFKRKRNFWW